MPIVSHIPIAGRFHPFLASHVQLQPVKCMAIGKPILRTNGMVMAAIQTGGYWAVHPSFTVWHAALHSSPPAHLHSLIMPIEELLDFGLGNPIMPSTSKKEGVNLSQNTGSKSFYLTYFWPFILHTG